MKVVHGDNEVSKYNISDSTFEINCEENIKTLKKLKSKFKNIICPLQFIYNLSKNNLTESGVLHIQKEEKTNDLEIRKFCENNGLLFYKNSYKYMCINFKNNHKKYDYIGDGTSCRAFKNGNEVVKIYHNYTEDYYKDLCNLNQIYIKFPTRISDETIECDGVKVHIIVDSFIGSDKTLDKENFINKVESFTNAIIASGKFPKIDLYFSNLRCFNGSVYLIDTHRRNKLENNDFILDRQSWNKYTPKTIVVDGKTYNESYSQHNIVVYENGTLTLKDVVNKEYNDYHNIDGISGKRDCNSRIQEFDINDIKGKSILDIGCSMGGMIIASSKLGAKWCVGLEYNHKSVELARKYCIDNSILNVDIRLQDIDDFDWFRNIEKFDTVFLLSILNTSKFSEKDSLISIANRLGKVLYIEGHSGEHHNAYMKKLYYHTDYTKFTHKYVVDGLGKRPLIRCGYETPLNLSKRSFNVN